MKYAYPFLLLLLSITFVGCGVNTSLLVDHNMSATQIELGESNYEVVKKVSGSSKNWYVLGIGGLSNRQLVENAKSKMMDAADLTGSSKAVTHITYDRWVGGFFPFYYEVELTASGYVVEFKD